MKQYVWIIACVCLLFAGCAQNTEAPVNQPARTVQAPIAEQGALGSNSDVKIYIINAPGSNGVPNDAATVVNLAGLQTAATSQPSVDEVTSDGAGSAVRDTRAGYTMAGLTVNVQTGGSSTGPQSTGAVGPQTVAPQSTVTQTPTQKPEFTASVPVAVGLPGSAPNATANTASGQGTATQSAQYTADLKTALTTLAGTATNPAQLAAIQALWQMLFPGTAPPASQPTVPQ